MYIHVTHRTVMWHGRNGPLTVIVHSRAHLTQCTQNYTLWSYTVVSGWFSDVFPEILRELCTSLY